MKKLTLILLLFFITLSAANCQIVIEKITPSGTYTTRTNDTALVHLEVRNDSLLIHCNNSVAVYRVESIVVVPPSENGLFLGFCKVFILNDRYELVSVTMWEGLNLVIFDYKDGTQYLNSGEGISYTLKQ